MAPFTMNGDAGNLRSSIYDDRIELESRGTQSHHFSGKSGTNIPTRVKANTLLLAIILATIMALALSLAIQPIRVRSMREKETLLIYRGEHISKGICDYYFRMGRFPFDLEELLEIEPRVVRKLYKDPMTQSGEWDLVYLGQENRSSLDLLKKKFFEINGQEPRKSYQASSSSGTQIVGIKSLSQGTGYRQYQGSRIYSDWFFNALSGSKKGPLESIKKQVPGLYRH